MAPKRTGRYETPIESQYVSDVRKSAEEAFASGLYCAESVVVALANAPGIESDLLPLMATAFCSGMARPCGTCGTLTGAITGISLALGRSKSGEPVQTAYAATQRLVGEFEQEFGARDCHVLLGCELSIPKGQTTFRESQLGLRCANYTGKAAEIAARFWQRLATQYPATVLNGYTANHPGTAYRIAAINKTMAEIKGKQAGKKPLLP